MLDSITDVHCTRLGKREIEVKMQINLNDASPTSTMYCYACRNRQTETATPSQLL